MKVRGYKSTDFQGLRPAKHILKVDFGVAYHAKQHLLVDQTAIEKAEELLRLAIMDLSIQGFEHCPCLPYELLTKIRRSNPVHRGAHIEQH